MNKKAYSSLIEENIYILKCILSGNDVIYVSTPINTGSRYIEWYTNIGKTISDRSLYRASKMKMVIELNIKDAELAIQKLRNMSSKVIIDPTILENDSLNWSQDQFYEFWDYVIENLVNEIVFLDGWEYSIGCCFEMLSAVKNKLKIYSQRMEELSYVEIVSKIDYSSRLYLSNNMGEADRIMDILDIIKENVYQAI